MMRRKRILLLLPVYLLWSHHAAFAWSFGVCGDSRDDARGIFPRILASVEKSDMEFLLHTGDLETRGGAAFWRKFRETTKGFSKPLRLVIGNHERDGATGEEFARFFGLPGTSYSFTHKDAHFAVVDNADGNLSDDRLDRLDKDLAAHPKGRNGIRTLVVAMHIPPRTDTIFPHATARNYDVQSGKLRTILARRGVDLLLCGHEHLHHVEDWGGIKVIVSGGAGAPLYPLHRFGFYRVDLDKGRVREQFIRIRAKSSSPRR